MKRTFLLLLLALALALPCAARAEDLPIIDWVTPTPEITPTPTPLPTPSPTPANNSIGGYRGEFIVETRSHRVNLDRSILVDSYCAVDGDLNTAWNSNKKTDGQWIEMSVADGNLYEVSGIRIANGYWKNEEVYANNFRLRNVDVYCDDLLVASYEFQDVISYQTFWFPDTVLCSRVKLVIKDGYQWLVHHTYKDCALTELDLIGPGGDTLSRYAMDDWGRSVRALLDETRYGITYSMGQRTMGVVGLQLLLSEGFGLYDGAVNGIFDAETMDAADLLSDRFRETLGDAALAMEYGVVDENFVENMLSYMDTL